MCARQFYSLSWFSAEAFLALEVGRGISVVENVRVVNVAYNHLCNNMKILRPIKRKVHVGLQGRDFDLFIYNGT